MLFEQKWKGYSECVLAWVSDMELNKLTKKLLAEGFSKDNPPSNFRSWNDFYGGWEYSIEQERNIIIETPCGCVGNAATNGANGITSYMGVDWRLENNNALVACPFNKFDCEKRDKLLHNSNWGSHTWCNTHIIEKAFDYDKSIEKIKEENRKKYEKLKDDYIKSKNGYVCEIQLRFDEKAGKFKQSYNPIECAYYNCNYCSLRHRELGKEKGNIFYDKKIARIEKGVGFFADEKKISIFKGNRLFEKSIKLSIAEEIVKRCESKIIEKVESRYSSDLFFAKYHNIFFELEVLNIRAEKRESRDLEQDLSDIADGIKVIHASDEINTNKQLKAERKQKSIENKKKKYLKIIEKNGLDDLGEYKYRINRAIEKGLIGDNELQEAMAKHKNPTSDNQLNFFESEVE